MALNQPVTVGAARCLHGLRGLGLREQARTLLGNVKQLNVVELAGPISASGFGGLFAIKMPTSRPMLQQYPRASELPQTTL